jgi:hypothetical protein
MVAAPSVDVKVAERRVAARLQPAFRTICRLNRLEAGHSAIGLVWDLSETGVSMLMAKPPKPGAELTGELTPEDGGQAVPVQLRVIHVKPMMTGDFIMGARFGSPLPEEHLKSFLAASTARPAVNWTLPRKG